MVIDIERMDWDTYFFEILEVIKQRSGCLRRKVSALIVSDKRILATGYNASPVGVIDCVNRGCCLREKAKQGECLENCMAVHAEMNAILQCARYGINTNGATIYVNTFPCVNCMKAIINASIKEIVYLEDYKNTELSRQLAEESGIKIRKYLIN